MNLLLEIKDKKIPAEKTYKTREAVRAVLFDKNNLMPLIFASKHNYHKLPGGGIDEGEDKEQALLREILEEAGCTAEITSEVGKIIEFRSEFNQLQTSYCYIGKVISKEKPNLTEEEIKKGFELIWLPLNKAITTIEKDLPDSYEGYFVQKRDLKFLQTAKEVIKN